MHQAFMRWSAAIAIALTICTGLSAPGRPASAQATLPYASIKDPAQPITGRDALHLMAPIPYPERGVLIVGGSGLTASAVWTIVDVGAGTIVWVRTITQMLPDGEVEMVVSSRQGRPLAIGELNGVIEQANAVWNPPRPPALPPMLTDVSCDVVLFDGTAVPSDFGSVCPAEHLVKAIRALQLPPAPGR